MTDETIPSRSSLMELLGSSETLIVAARGLDVPIWQLKEWCRERIIRHPGRFTRRARRISERHLKSIQKPSEEIRPVADRAERRWAVLFCDRDVRFTEKSNIASCGGGFSVSRCLTYDDTCLYTGGNTDIPVPDVAL